MFSKSEKNNGGRIETVIGSGTEMEGNLHVNEAMRIDGKIKGEVHANAVVIGELGVVLGDITANSVTIGGKVKGNVTATVTLELLPKGQILGDIHTSKLIISDGATFEGNCQMMKAEGQVLEVNPQLLSVDDHENGNPKQLKVIPSNGKR